MIENNTGSYSALNSENDWRKDSGSSNSGRHRLTEIMKYAMVIVIIAYIVLLMLYTSGSTRPFSKIQGAVEKVLDTKNLMKADRQGLKRYYGLNSADYDGVMLYTSKASLSAEEVLLIKVKNDGQVNEVKESIKKRLKSRKNDFEGYAPKQAQMIDQAQLSIRGKYIFLAVSPKAQQYKEAFSKSL